MTIVLSLAIIIGILNCMKTISDTRLGYRPATKPSKNLISFTFLNE
jgi:hypothetical protein